MSLQAQQNLENVFQKVIDILEENSRGAKVGVYSVALIALAAAIRRVRPFTQFKKPKDIPNHFIIERRELSGVVKSIEPTNAILMVMHKPLVNLPFRTNSALAVKLSGINVSGNGISWLHAIVVNSNVKFIPVVKESNWVQCEVFAEQQPKAQLLNVAESLVAIGFGTLQENQKQLINRKYYKKLKVAENIAIRKKMGYKYYVKSTVDILFKMSKSMYGFIINRTRKPIKPVKVVIS